MPAVCRPTCGVPSAESNSRDRAACNAPARRHRTRCDGACVAARGPHHRPLPRLRPGAGRPAAPGVAPACTSDRGRPGRTRALRQQQHTVVGERRAARPGRRTGPVRRRPLAHRQVRTRRRARSGDGCAALAPGSLVRSGRSARSARCRFAAAGRCTCARCGGNQRGGVLADESACRAHWHTDGAECGRDATGASALQAPVAAETRRPPPAAPARSTAPRRPLAADSSEHESRAVRERSRQNCVSLRRLSLAAPALTPRWRRSRRTGWNTSAHCCGQRPKARLRCCKAVRSRNATCAPRARTSRRARTTP